MKRWIQFVHITDALLHVVLDRPQGRHDGRGPEAVGDGGEVGQMSLDARLQHRWRSGVAQWRPVLVQQLHQFMAHIPGNIIGNQC